MATDTKSEGGASKKPHNLPEHKIEYFTDKVTGKRKKKIMKLVKKEKELSPEQEEEIRSAFDLFDKDGGGSIDIHELRDVMKALGVYLSKDKVKAMMKEVDTDGSGTVEFDEFRNMMKDKIKSRNSEEELRRAFRIYDEDDTGKIEFDDLWRVANELDSKLTEDEVRGMIYEADRDKDNEVSVDEFLHVMKKAKLW